MLGYSVFLWEAYHKQDYLNYSLCWGVSAQRKSRECFLSLATGK